MGEYGVQAILQDPELMALSGVFIVCANDPVGAAGAVHNLTTTYGIQADLIAGPATDNRVGERFGAGGDGAGGGRDPRWRASRTLTIC